MANLIQLITNNKLTNQMHRVDRQTLEHQIEQEIKHSRQMKQAARLHYYQTINYDSRAITSWEQFVGTWTYVHWIELHRPTIDAFIEDQHRRFHQVWTY